MSESYPSHGAEFGPNEPKKSGENAGSSKKEGPSSAGSRPERAGGGHKPFSPEANFRTPSVHELAGMALQEQRDRFDAARRSREAHREEEKTSENKDKAETAGTEKSAPQPVDGKDDTRANAEQGNPNDITARNTSKDAASGEKLKDDSHTVEQSAEGKSASSKHESAKGGSSEDYTAQRSTDAEKDEPDEFTEMMRDMSELAAATSGETLKHVEGKAEPSKRGPAEERAPEYTSETEAAFQDVTNHPELADLASKQLPEVSVDEQTEPEAFEQWIQEHPELQTPELMAASNTDEVFNDIVQNSLDEEAPGNSRYHEQEPGEQPIDAEDTSGNVPAWPLKASARQGSNQNGAPGFNPNTQNIPNPNQPVPSAGNSSGGNKPPNPPMANAGGNYYGNPNSPNFGNAYNPNPNVLNNPWIPAGGLTDPAVWAAIGALEAQQQLNSLRHSRREAGLAGAVGILGLGLVLEHIFAKRRDKKQQRQINRQGKIIRETNRTLEQEHYSHLRTQQESRRQIETLNTHQARTTEELRRVQEHRTKQERTIRAAQSAQPGKAGLSRAEVALGGGLISGAAAAELGVKVGDSAAKEKQAAAKQEEQALQERLATNPEFARAFRQNQASQMAAELAGAAPVTEAMRELKHERMQDKTADAGLGGSAAPRAATSGGAGSNLPVTDGQGHPMTTARYATETAKAVAKREEMTRLNKPWTWTIIGFGLVALLAIVLGG